MSVSHGSRNPDVRTGASVIALRPDAVLMVQRAKAPFAGLWSFPGGGTKAGESADETALRELLEETGLRVERLVRLGEFRPDMTGVPLVLTVFAARAPDGEPLAASDALCAAYVPLAEILMRQTTAGAPGWIARAILALAGEPADE